MVQPANLLRAPQRQVPSQRLAEAQMTDRPLPVLVEAGVRARRRARPPESRSARALARSQKSQPERMPARDAGGAVARRLVPGSSARAARDRLARARSGVLHRQ